MAQGPAESHLRLSVAGSYDVFKPMKEQLCHPAGTFQGTRLATAVDGSLGIAPGAKEFHTGVYPSKFSPVLWALLLLLLCMHQQPATAELRLSML